MKPHHIGYLIRDMEKAINEFEQLGYERTSGITYDDYRDIEICFLQNAGVCVELVRAVSEKSVVYALSKKIGASPYHICYQVEDVEAEAATLRERGYLPIGEAMPAPALEGVLAAFFYSKQMGILELIGKE